MRIAHYMTGLWLPGGVGSYIRRVSDAQRDAGHEVSFFDLERHRSAEGEWPGAVYVRDETELFREVQRRGVDIIHAHTLVEGAVESPAPLIRTLHGHEPYCPSGGKFLPRAGRACERSYQPLRCAMAHWVDRCGSARPGKILVNLRRARGERRATSGIHVIAVSDFLRREMLREGYEANRVHTVHHPAPERLAIVPMVDGAARFVFLGRLTPEKGVDWLLRSAARVKSPLIIDIAGKGNAQSALESLARSLNISDRVHFHGWLSQGDVARLLQESRALVFPSLWPEPAGLVAFDAMAQGRAVIASRVGGIPELVDESAAVLIEPGDVAALADAMDELAADGGRAASLGAAGHARLDRFTLASHLGQLAEMYQLAITDHALGKA